VMEGIHTEGKVADIVDFFLDVLGKLLSDDYTPARMADEEAEQREQELLGGTQVGSVPMSLSLSLSSGGGDAGPSKGPAADNNRSYALISQRPSGTTLSDLLRMMPQAQFNTADGPDVNVKDVARELKAIDQAVVVRDATQKQC